MRSGSLRRLSLNVFLAWTAVAALESTSIAVAALIAGRPLNVYRVVGSEFVAAYLWVPVTIFIFLLAKRAPLLSGPKGAWRYAGRLAAAGIPLLAVRIALFHHIGQAVGFLRPGMPVWFALAAFAGESILVLVVIVGAAHSLEMARANRERELSRSQLEAQLARARLQSLAAQVQPHFLFNTLNAISTLVHVAPERAERSIAHLSDMLRATLAQTSRDEVPLREEVNLLGSYLEIERMRLGTRVAIHTDFPAESLPALVPHLLLQPLVENAIRHGVSGRMGPGSISVSTAVEDGFITLTVADDGVGMTPGRQRKGIGLSNTRARLQQLYSDRHSFTIDSTPGKGTVIRIAIPFRVDTTLIEGT